jgi:hypothetical protein
MSIQQLFGNMSKRFLNSGRMLLFCLSFTSLHVCVCAQTFVSKWEWNVTATVHPPSQLDGGNNSSVFKAKACVGFQVGVSRKILKFGEKELAIGYDYGNTPVYLSTNLTAEKFPIIRTDFPSRYYYLDHPYHVIKCKLDLFVHKKYWFGIEIANRVYLQSNVGASTYVVNATAPSLILAIRARTQTNNSRYLSPHLKLSFTGTIWKRFPSFLYETSLCYAPISALDGSFVLFPNDPAYTSSGTFRVQQSYLGLAIKYRRVK